jgi:two-component system, NarL family, response regulator NreC
VYKQQYKHRIVIVDDSADVRRDLRLLLEISGLEVVGEAADGREAIEKAALLDPDVVVSDLVMPVLDGYAAAAAIRAALPQCRLVALSIHSDDSGRRKARTAGFDAFVVKGAPLLELLGAISPLTDETSPGSDIGGRS